MSRIGRHCDVDRANDPIFCGTGRTRPTMVRSSATPPSTAPLTDSRVRAVVALAPVGVVFTAQSLAEIRIPVTIYEAAFRHGNLFVRADVVQKKGNRLRLIEVKAKSWDPELEDPILSKKTPTSLKSEYAKYLYDVAFQAHVA